MCVVCILFEVVKNFMDIIVVYFVVVMLKNMVDMNIMVDVLKLWFFKEGFEIIVWNELFDFYEKIVEFYNW